MLGQTASIHSVLTSGNLGTWETKIKNNRIKANFRKEPMCPDEDSPVEENMVHLYQ